MEKHYRESSLSGTAAIGMYLGIHPSKPHSALILDIRSRSLVVAGKVNTYESIVAGRFLSSIDRRDPQTAFIDNSYVRENQDNQIGDIIGEIGEDEEDEIIQAEERDDSGNVDIEVVNQNARQHRYNTRSRGVMPEAIRQNNSSQASSDSSSSASIHDRDDTYSEATGEVSEEASTFLSCGKDVNGGDMKYPPILPERPLLKREQKRFKHLTENAEITALMSRLYKVDGSTIPVPINEKDFDQLKPEIALAWILSDDREIEMQLLMKCWKYEFLPTKNALVVKSGWVRTVKTDKNGIVSSFKSRGIMKGYNIKENYHFSQYSGYSPVITMHIFRLMLALSFIHKLCLKQLDVKSAFCQTNLTLVNQSVYAEEYAGYELMDSTTNERLKGPNGERVVMRLEKAVYGLPTSSSDFFIALRKSIIDLGLIQCEYSQCLFTHSSIGNSDFLCILVYVDDLLIMAAKENVAISFYRQFTRRWKTSPLQEVNIILGLQITVTENEVSMKLEKSIKEALIEFGLQYSNTVTTPGDGIYLSKDDGNNDTVVDKEKLKRTPLRELVGYLQYVATHVRADICGSVSKIAQVINTPSMNSWTAAKRILRYLKRTSTIGLNYNNRKNDTLIAYTDSDWGGDKDTRRSVSAYGLLLGGALIAYGR